ncbi:MAG TPA: Rieske 2Fe-2S domain-containing protein [Chloroflexota bacterium]|nr:Rieske 2Fe-2S domain-containing protein [Chloroflexota bacterium]
MARETSAERNREDLDMDEEEFPGTSRGNLLLLIGGGICAILGGLYFAFTVRYMQRADPGAHNTKPKRVSLLGLRWDDGVAGPIPYDMGDNGIPGIFLVREGQGLLALEQTCTHQGCAVSWTPNDQRFECPCHGSQFDKQGNVVAGPAPYGLYRHRLSLITNAVIIEGRV